MFKYNVFNVDGRSHLDFYWGFMYAEERDRVSFFNGSLDIFYVS